MVELLCLYSSFQYDTQDMSRNILKNTILVFIVKEKVLIS